MRNDDTKLLLNNTWGKERHENYNQLEWVRDQDFLEKFVRFINPKPDDVVLDLGTGTGVVAHALAKRCKRVVGIDIDERMIKQAQKIPTGMSSTHWLICGYNQILVSLIK